ncbi:MAG TPA: LON peptidase substrate-binding domain-containing protein [Stellaceae bacterium]|nr:LON peptidase substrate-binding domain-containing protein [Stellaceae bacterium]
MAKAPFEPRPEDLPERIPIFPLSGVLLLPRGRLPLNIFEPRYLAMIRDALAAPQRLIGMIQPRDDHSHGAGVIPGEPDICPVGCAGRIVSFAETGDGRYLIELKGVARFAVMSDMMGNKLYRSAIADWSRYRGDLDEAPKFIDRDKLIAVLKPYFQHLGVNTDWRALEAMMDDRLVNTVAMLSPFAPQEKQALLEAEDTKARGDLLIALIEMAVKANAGPPTQVN